MNTKKYKWISIIDLGRSVSGKTKIFSVVSRQSKAELGIIKWLPSWRRYAFFPTSDSFYEEECLQDIASFLIGLKVARGNLKEK